MRASSKGKEKEDPGEEGAKPKSLPSVSTASRYSKSKPSKPVSRKPKKSLAKMKRDVKQIKERTLMSSPLHENGTFTEIMEVGDIVSSTSPTFLHAHSQMADEGPRNTPGSLLANVS